MQKQKTVDKRLQLNSSAIKNSSFNGVIFVQKLLSGSLFCT